MLQATCERLERRIVELSAVEASLHAELAAAQDAATGRESLQLRVQSLEEGQQVRQHNMEGQHLTKQVQDHMVAVEEVSRLRQLVAELDARCATQQQELLTAIQHAARLEARAADVDRELQTARATAQVCLWRLCCGKTAVLCFLLLYPACANQAAELRVVKAEQAVGQEVVRRLAAVADDPSHWPATARAAVADAQRGADELRVALEAARAACDAATADRDATLAQQVRLQWDRPYRHCCHR